MGIGGSLIPRLLLTLLYIIYVYIMLHLNSQAVEYIILYLLHIYTDPEWPKKVCKLSKGVLIVS